MPNRIDRHIIRFFLVVLIQVYILNNVLFYNIINPYIYIYFILLLPFQLPKAIQTILGFIIGISIDFFTGSLAIHTISSTFLGYFRPYILKLFAPFDGYDTNSAPTLQFYDLSWWIKYSLTATFLHHSILFISETFHFANLGMTFIKVVVSTILTTFLMTLLQYFFHKSKS